MPSPRPHPVALIGLGLAVLGAVAYLWLMREKGDGRFEPAWWFVGLVALGCVEVGYGALLTGRARQVAVASGGALLVVTAGLSPLALETSHTAALLGSVGLLVAAGGITAILAARPRITSRGLVAAGAAAALVVAVALPTAWSLASQGEGVGGASAAG